MSMSLEDARTIVHNMGVKHARAALLRRRQKEIIAELGKLELEIEASTAHAATASAVLEQHERGGA